MKRAFKWVGIAAGGLLLVALLAALAVYGLLKNTVACAVRLARRSPDCRRRSRWCATGGGAAHLRQEHRRPLRARSASCMRRTGCGRWSCSAVPARDGCPRSSASAPLQPTCSCARSISMAMPNARSRPCPMTSNGRSRPMRAASTPSSTRRTGWFEPRVPPEFLLLRHRPEPWQPADSMVTIKLMALQLSTNLNHELLRLALAAQGLNSAEIEDLMPLDAVDRPPPLPEIASLYPLRRPQTAQRRADASVLVDDLIGSGASNNWVVSGARTKSGKPLLANDPHLRLAAPAIWYLVHLGLERPGAAPVNAVGASLPGLPHVVLGRGDSVAWGFTNTGPDVQDLFIEQVNPNNPREYKTPEGWRPFIVEEMQITVKGEGVRKVERRRTRHGPVLPGFYRDLEGLLAPNHVAALQWTALSDDDTTIAAGMFDPNLRTVGDYMRAHAPVRGADAEHGGGGHQRAHRHDRAGPRAGARHGQQGGRPRAGARLGRGLRLEGVSQVRGVAQGGRGQCRRHRHGQRAHGRSGLSPPPDLRLGCALPPAARQGADLRPATSTTSPACAPPRPTCCRWPSARCSR